ncbi:uncharacterized protein EV422DRAFT_563684 [Fimicolochytrium jonesii]|uniref:uncharacterized protein n=1 Tax=Fimicolochytrium jonesii TaxID=1396493 RepID=UPI0022FE7340|nr:uncharacterized protein EV422DRAFT_563684 [Fimicolochytrium jonesii]KAI8825855.1 hypothetical protein EV422DRAFT_563684 [Fimicolochytrium jonesii]
MSESGEAGYRGTREQEKPVRPAGGLLNQLLTDNRARARQRPARQDRTVGPRHYRKDIMVDSDGNIDDREKLIAALEGLDGDCEEVRETKHGENSKTHSLVPRPYVHKTTGLALVRTNYYIRKSSNRETRPMEKQKPFQALNAKFHAQSYVKNIRQLPKNKHFVMFFVWIDLLVDCLMCIAYIDQISVSAPLTDVSPSWLFFSRPRWLWVALVVCSVYNLGSFLTRIVGTAEKRKALFSVEPLLDLLTAVPFIVSLFLPNGQNLYVPYFLRVWYVRWRALRVLGAHASIDSDSGAVAINPVRQQLTNLFVLILALLFSMMCAFQWAELAFAGTTYTAIDVLYFSFVTASTIGYGDISPSHWVSRLITIAFIVLILTLIPGLIGDFLEAWRLNQDSSKTYVPGRNQHIILIGNFTNANRVQDLLNGFLDIRNNNSTDTHLILVGSKEAPRAVESLLTLPFYKSCTTYIQGTPLNESDFRRMKSKDAAAAFVLAHRNATDWFEEDQHTTLAAWSFHIHNPKVPLYAEVLLPETAAFQQMARVVICVDQIKQVLIAYNSLYPGMSTLILNLIFQSNPSTQCVYPWEFQYSDGLANEIYTDTANPIFVGRSFTWVSWYLYVEFQVTLFAISPEPSSATDAVPEHGRNTLPSWNNEREYAAGSLLLNPGRNYKIQKGDVCYYIANVREEVDRIGRMTAENLRNSLRQYGIRDECLDVTVNIDPPGNEERKSQANTRLNQPSAATLTAPSYNIINASDDESDEDDRNGAMRMRKTSHASNQPATATVLNGPPTPPAPPLDDCHPDPMVQIKQETFQGRPEAPYTATASEQPPVCHLLRIQRTNVSECLVDDATHLRDHIIVCAGEQPLFRFLCTLRSVSLSSQHIRDILIVGPKKPSDQEFSHNLAVFPGIYYMVADCRRRDDMLRTGIEYARTICILSKPENAFANNPAQSRSSDTTSDDLTTSFADSAAVMTTHVVHQILASCGVPVNTHAQDIVGGGENGDESQGIVGPVKQLHENQQQDAAEETQQDDTIKMGEEIEITELHSKPVRETPYVTLVTELLDRKNIRFLHALQSAAPIIDHLHSPVYAAGYTVVSALLDNFVYAVYQNPAIIDIVKAFCGDYNPSNLSEPFTPSASQNGGSPTPESEPDLSASQRSFLKFTPIPNAFKGKTYGELYRHLAFEADTEKHANGAAVPDADHSSIPVGLLRPPNQALGNSLPFVYTNPVPSLVLLRGDQVAVLRN